MYVLRITPSKWPFVMALAGFALVSGCLGDFEPPEPTIVLPPPDATTSVLLESPASAQGLYEASVPIVPGSQPVTVSGTVSYGFHRGNDQAEFVFVQAYIRSQAGVSPLALNLSLSLPDDLSAAAYLNGDPVVPRIELIDGAFGQDFQREATFSVRVHSPHVPAVLHFDIAVVGAPESTTPPWIKLDAKADRAVFGNVTTINDESGAGLLSFRDGHFKTGTTVIANAGPLTASFGDEAKATWTPTSDSLVAGVGFVPVVEGLPLGMLTAVVEAAIGSGDYKAGLFASQNEFVFGSVATPTQPLDVTLTTRGVADFYLVSLKIPDGGLYPVPD